MVANLRGAGLFVLISFSALGGPRSLAIATGDCRDPELLNGATAFSDAIAQKLGTNALDPAQVLERLRPRPLAGLDDAQRQIEAAQSQFYSGQNDRALEVVRQALKSLERIAPSEAVFKQIAAGRVLEGLVLKGQNKKNEQVEAWKQVLRVQPGFSLDPDYYTPATVAQFDQLKKDMKKAPRVQLSVNSSPTGVSVYLDGALIGVTPLKDTFPEGSYRLTAAKGDLQSFVYDVKLDHPREIQMDLAFEGSLRPQLPLCVNALAGNFERALELAARAGADQALVLRVESYNSEPGWVAAVLLEVHQGARVREGGMKVAAARKGSGYADLASFVLTGEPAKLSLSSVAPPEAWAPSDAVASPPPPAAMVESAPIVSESVPSRSRTPRIVSGVVMGAGAVLGLVGLGLYVSGTTDRASLGNLLDSYGNLKNRDTSDMAGDLDRKVTLNRAGSLALGITGIAAVAVGAVLFFVLGSHDAPAVSAVVTPGGAFVGLSGALP